MEIQVRHYDTHWEILGQLAPHNHIQLTGLCEIQRKREKHVCLSSLEEGCNNNKDDDDNVCLQRSNYVFGHAQSAFSCVFFPKLLFLLGLQDKLEFQEHFFQR